MSRKRIKGITRKKIMNSLTLKHEKSITLTDRETSKVAVESHDHTYFSEHPVKMLSFV